MREFISVEISLIYVKALKTPKKEGGISSISSKSP
jgi:hypothetical protein